ncbi:hypothetical protein ACRRGR_003490 [Vibrio alginolyticus]
MRWFKENQRMPPLSAWSTQPRNAAALSFGIRNTRVWNVGTMTCRRRSRVRPVDISVEIRLDICSILSGN